MADKGGLAAKLAGLYKSAYRKHYLPYLGFFYGGEYLHYGDEPARPAESSWEAWERELGEKVR